MRILLLMLLLLMEPRQSLRLKQNSILFERLDGQISDYSKAFEHIHVVIPEKKINDWVVKIPQRVGVTVLSDKYTLRELRPASSNIETFDLEVMFSCFRRSEFITAIENQFGYIPECKPVELKARCREIISYARASCCS